MQHNMEYISRLTRLRDLYAKIMIVQYYNIDKQNGSAAVDYPSPSYQEQQGLAWCEPRSSQPLSYGSDSTHLQYLPDGYYDRQPQTISKHRRSGPNETL